MAHVKSINIQYISMILAYIIVSGDRVEKGCYNTSYLTNYDT